MLRASRKVFRGIIDDRKRLEVVNTQYNIQMRDYRIVHLKPVILLINVTPINSIKRKKRIKPD